MSEDTRTAYERQWAGERPTPAQAPEPQPTVTPVPENMHRLIAAAKGSGWDPYDQAAMIGAAHFDVDVQVKIMDRARAAGSTAGGSAFETETLNALHLLKVRAEAERRLASEAFSSSVELSWDDLEDAKRDYLVQDLVPCEGVVFLFARSNIGKTFTYLDMACRMATGQEFLGKVTRPAKVLIVLGEGKAGFMGRLKGWLIANEKTADDLRPWLSFIDGANLNNDESLARIKEVAEREAVELVIFDTWAGTSGVHKEDDAALNSETLRRVQMALPSRALMFIHHPRKAEQDTDTPVMRGSGALDGRADVVMSMYRDHKFIPATGERHEFIALSTEAEHNGKNRDAQTETIRGLYLDEVELPSGDMSRVMRQVGSESIRRESRFVREHLTQAMSLNEFIEASAKSKTTAHRYLKFAIEDGVAVKARGPLGTELYEPTQKWAGLLETAREEVPAWASKS